MDDLSSLQWTAPNPSKPAAATSSFPALRPTHSPLGSGRNTPLSAQGSTPGGSSAFKPPATSKAAQESSFSNLVNFGTAKSAANLTLRERQDLLEAERRKKEEERRKQTQAHYGDANFLDSLGSQSGTPRTSSPAIAPPSGPSAAPTRSGKPAESDDDLFAAFSASTKVDNSSHFPPPAASNRSSPANAAPLNLGNPQAWNKPIIASGGGGLIDDDDDPFGLNQLKMKATAPPPPAPPIAEDDDFLGDLGRPVEEVRRKQPQPQPQRQPPSFSRAPEPGKAIEDSSSDSEPESNRPSNDPFDKAVAQLVDYGFTPENARRGLTESGGGLNVQAAVNWLLDDAHRQAKEKAKGGQGSGLREPVGNAPGRASSQSRNGAPSWTREAEGARSSDNRSPASSDADFTKTAAAVGTSLLKTANSFWKQGQKKVQKAVQEFQQEGGDPSQPKWMRSTQQDLEAAGEKRRPDVTDEAMMLDSGIRPGRRPGMTGPDSRPSSNTTSRDQSPAFPGARPVQGSSVPKWQQGSQSAGLDPRSRLSKQAVEEQSSQAYVSPARRKKTTLQPPPEAEPDLLFGSAEPPRSQPQVTLPSRPAQPSPAPRLTPRQSPAPRPAPAPRPQRVIPNVSAIALQSSTKHRLDGTAHFKRGDYAAAHASYTSSLTSIPPTHPLTILLLCNRALTALKTGEPRQAVEDADNAIKLIGPTKGEGEKVELHGGDTEKRDMRELYGKALTRKAEALEQMEKWSDAMSVWQLCIESGHGGATATAGRQRCQKALAPKPAARSVPARAAPPAARRPTPAATQKSSEAVARLRAANKAAEKEGDEKLALIDQVDARIAAWRDGKGDNLRALLGSMENVLWESSGWKKVGLHELVMTNKVKIIYMKAIGKTHPDKVSSHSPFVGLGALGH